MREGNLLARGKRSRERLLEINRYKALRVEGNSGWRLGIEDPLHLLKVISGRRRWNTGLRSLTVEYVFGVAGPDFIVSLLVGKGASPCGVAGHHVEPSIG